MKKVLQIIFPVLLLPVIIQAQGPVKKVYAYSRNFIAGKPTIKAAIGAKPVISAVPTRTEYYLFIEGDIDTAEFKCTAVWINKKSYAVAGFKKIDVPYSLDLKTVDGKKVKELVPKSEVMVLQIWPGKTDKSSPGKQLRQLTTLNKLVLEIVYKQKKYYPRKKSITALPAAEDV